MDEPAIHFAPYVECGSNRQQIPKGQSPADFKGECSDAASRYAVRGATVWLAVALAATYHVAGPLL